MDAVVCAWSNAEADEAEKKRKEAEIIKYKMQDHVVRICILNPAFLSRVLRANA